MPDPVIELRNATIGYAERAVVHEADLRIDRGDVVAVLGPNGSGKTTLVRGVLGLALVLGGQVELFGVPSSRFDQRWRIGYVPQRHTVGGPIPSTVQEVVASGRLPRQNLLAWPTRADRRAVAGAIETVGLSPQCSMQVGRLSGGQQRRVLIARALASEPEVLVMDEPTAGVDVASQQALAETLATLAGAGTTLVVVTHEIGPLQALLTRAVVVRDGRIGYDGPLTAELVAAHDPGGPHAHTDTPAPRGGFGLAGSTR